MMSTTTEQVMHQEVVSGSTSLYVQGCLVYRTFDVVKHSAFCFVYKGGITKHDYLDACPDGNYAD